MKRKTKISLVGLLLLAVIVTQPACWDQREVEQLGIVMGIGVEPASGERVRVLVQNMAPAATGKDAAGGGGGGGGQNMGGNAYRNRSREGDTIFEAMREIAQESSRRMFFAHNQVIIISESLARERGVKEIMDFFERNPEIRRTTWLLIGRGDLATLLDEPGRIEDLPAQRIVSIIDQQDRYSRYAVLRLGDFLELLESESTHPFTAVVETIPNPAAPNAADGHGQSAGQVPQPLHNIRLYGTAVFRRDKLIGWLDPRESRGLQWLRNQVKGGDIDMPAPAAKGKSISLEIIRSKTKLQPEIRDGQIYITVKIKEEGNLTETTGPLDLTNPETIRKLEQIQAATIQAEIEAALNKAQQEYGVDVFGFGEAVHRKYPREWKEMKKMWPELFPGVQVQFEIESKIRRTGLISKPVEPRQQ